MVSFSLRAEATWTLSVKIGKQLVNYANISIIMEPFPHVRNIEFVPKSIIMQGKYCGISGKENFYTYFKIIKHIKEVQSSTELII